MVVAEAFAALVVASTLFFVILAFAGVAFVTNPGATFVVVSATDPWVFAFANVEVDVAVVDAAVFVFVTLGAGNAAVATSMVAEFRFALLVQAAFIAFVLVAACVVVTAEFGAAIVTVSAVIACFATKFHKGVFLLGGSGVEKRCNLCRLGIKNLNMSKKNLYLYIYIYIYNAINISTFIN